MRPERLQHLCLETVERTGNLEVASMLRRAGARSSGQSTGGKVCVRPWRGNGYCGVVEEVNKTNYRIRVTELVGCADGCSARADCLEGCQVGGPDGIRLGESDIHCEFLPDPHKGPAMRA